MTQRPPKKDEAPAKLHLCSYRADFRPLYSPLAGALMANSLRLLDLSNTHFGDAGCAALAHGWRAATLLEHLDLRNASLTDIGLAQLCTLLRQPTSQLKTLLLASYRYSVRSKSEKNRPTSAYHNSLLMLAAQLSSHRSLQFHSLRPSIMLESSSALVASPIPLELPLSDHSLSQLMPSPSARSLASSPPSAMASSQAAQFARARLQEQSSALTALSAAVPAAHFLAPNPSSSVSFVSTQSNKDSGRLRGLFQAIEDSQAEVPLQAFESATFNKITSVGVELVLSALLAGAFERHAASVPARQPLPSPAARSSQVAPLRAPILALRPRLRLETLDLFGVDLGASGLAQLLAFLEMTANPHVAAAVDASTGHVIGSTCRSLLAAADTSIQANALGTSFVDPALISSNSMSSSHPGVASAATLARSEPVEEESMCLRQLSLTLPAVQLPPTDNDPNVLLIDRLVAFLLHSPSARRLRLLHFGWMSVYSQPIQPPMTTEALQHTSSTASLAAALTSPTTASAALGVSEKGMQGRARGLTASGLQRAHALRTLGNNQRAANPAVPSLNVTSSVAGATHAVSNPNSARKMSNSGSQSSLSQSNAWSNWSPSTTFDAKSKMLSKSSSNASLQTQLHQQQRQAAFATGPSALLTLDGVTVVDESNNSVLGGARYNPDHWFAQFQSLADSVVATSVLTQCMTTVAASALLPQQSRSAIANAGFDEQSDTSSQASAPKHKSKLRINTEAKSSVKAMWSPSKAFPAHHEAQPLSETSLEQQLWASRAAVTSPPSSSVQAKVDALAVAERAALTASLEAALTNGFEFEADHEHDAAHGPTTTNADDVADSRSVDQTEGELAPECHVRNPYAHTMSFRLLVDVTRARASAFQNVFAAGVASAASIHASRVRIAGVRDIGSSMFMDLLIQAADDSLSAEEACQCITRLFDNAVLLKHLPWIDPTFTPIVKSLAPPPPPPQPVVEPEVMSESDATEVSEVQPFTPHEDSLPAVISSDTQANDPLAIAAIAAADPAEDPSMTRNMSLSDIMQKLRNSISGKKTPAPAVVEPLDDVVEVSMADTSVVAAEVVEPVSEAVPPTIVECTSVPEPVALIQQPVEITEEPASPSMVVSSSALQLPKDADTDSSTGTPSSINSSRSTNSFFPAPAPAPLVKPFAVTVTAADEPLLAPRGRSSDALHDHSMTHVGPAPQAQSSIVSSPRSAFMASPRKMGSPYTSPRAQSSRAVPPLSLVSLSLTKSPSTQQVLVSSRSDLAPASAQAAEFVVAAVTEPLHSSRDIKANTNRTAALEQLRVQSAPHALHLQVALAAAADGAPLAHSSVSASSFLPAVTSQLHHHDSLSSVDSAMQHYMESGVLRASASALGQTPSGLVASALSLADLGGAADVLPVQMPRRMATSPLTVALGLHSGLPGGVGELGRDGKLNLTTTKPQTMLLAIQPVGPQLDDEWSSQPQCASLRPLVPMDGSAMLAPSIASALIPIVPDSISSITPAASQRLRAAGSNNKSLALLTDCVTSGTDGGAVQSALDRALDPTRPPPPLPVPGPNMKAGNFAGGRTFEAARDLVKHLPADPTRGQHKSPSILHSFKRKSHLQQAPALQRSIEQVYQTAVHSALMPSVTKEDLWSEIANGSKARIHKRRHQRHIHRDPVPRVFSRNVLLPKYQNGPIEVLNSESMSQSTISSKNMEHSRAESIRSTSSLQHAHLPVVALAAQELGVGLMPLQPKPLNSTLVRERSMLLEMVPPIMSPAHRQDQSRLVSQTSSRSNITGLTSSTATSQPEQREQPREPEQPQQPVISLRLPVVPAPLGASVSAPASVARNHTNNTETHQYPLTSRHHIRHEEKASARRSARKRSAREDPPPALERTDASVASEFTDSDDFDSDFDSSDDDDVSDMDGEDSLWAQQPQAHVSSSVPATIPENTVSASSLLADTPMAPRGMAPSSSMQDDVVQFDSTLTETAPHLAWQHPSVPLSAASPLDRVRTFALARAVTVSELRHVTAVDPMIYAPPDPAEARARRHPVAVPESVKRLSKHRAHEKRVAAEAADANTR